MMAQNGPTRLSDRGRHTEPTTPEHRGGVMAKVYYVKEDLLQFLRDDGETPAVLGIRQPGHKTVRPV
jgi:hypothetical protein